MTFGIDYASIDANMPPDVEKAKAAGVSFVYQRAAFTYRGKCLTDPHCNRDRGAWNAAGVPWGAYLILSYLATGPSPEDQARQFIAVVGDRGPTELPVMLDAETDSEIHDPATDAQRLDWLERAYRVLVARYGIVGTYTSQNQWGENFGDKQSEVGNGPGWIKVPYPYREDPPQEPHPEAVPTLTAALIPLPWKQPGSPGAWIEQIQGNARGLAGFNGTVDLSVFKYGYSAAVDGRSMWGNDQLKRFGFTTIADFQRAHGLDADNVIGPKTFALLCR